jgi:Maltose operon periplasmic protein precursor (MalM)
MIRSIVIAAATLFLAGCATTSTGNRPPESPPPASVLTVGDFSSLSFQQPVLGKAIDLDFDSKTTKYDNGSVVRMVHGIRLPQSSGELTVKVITKRQGSVSEPSIFYPELWILDSVFQTKKILPHQNFVFRAGRSGFLEATFFLKGAAVDEHYLVVTNREVAESDLKVTQTNETKSTMTAPGFAMWMLHTGTSTPPTKMIASTRGEVEVTIAEYKLRTIEQ